MNYLKDYNISLEQINYLKENFDNKQQDNFIYNNDKIKKILNIFLELGITNLYNIIITNPDMFFDTLDSIKKRIDNYDNKEELRRLLNEDALNLHIIGLL